ncbi:hypothetical protein G6M78_08260 [Agrobacterium tumefaciens]|uniref:hypothetical protein n=1 Tax=Agrobacterium tumefaciens TaxID=358 RepID=UPI00157261EA|nr:hypothetical protein [Agrobacterium tumefaciens]NTE55072.1 hypothetical protein [Agrobacterium tumefaciens]NTE73840.1 hypothetical protein [Agrobacterium tumefaciens]
MAVKIDETKLRKYFADAKSAHAALMAAWDDTRAARRELSDAELALTRAKAAAPHIDTAKHRPKSADALPDPIAVAERAVKSARAKLHRIESERERLSDINDHATRLRRSVSEFAQSQGALPADLAEEIR